MKRLLPLALVLLGSACTTAPNAPAMGSENDVDQARMSAVEGNAMNRGVKVYWVNPPRKAESGSGG